MTRRGLRTTTGAAARCHAAADWLAAGTGRAPRAPPPRRYKQLQILIHVPCHDRCCRRARALRPYFA